MENEKVKIEVEAVYKKIIEVDKADWDSDDEDALTKIMDKKVKEDIKTAELSSIVLLRENIK